MTGFKKILFTFVSFLLIFERSAFAVLAEEITVSPSPSEISSPIPSPEPVIENGAGVANNIDSTAETGENAVLMVSPSPTPIPSEVSSPTPSPESLIAEPTSIPESSESPSPTPTPDPSQVETGDAASFVEVENNVNSNVVNSSVVYHTLNIYLPDATEDIDLSLVAQNAVNKVYGTDGITDEVASVQVLSIDNFAYVENNIDSTANTGGNSVEGAGAGEIATGNAYSAVSVFNNVNTNIVDSVIHLVTINIFGNLDGNIILPAYVNEGGGECCGESVQLTNGAVVANNVASSAVSGENTAVVEKEGSIEMGNAQSAVNVFNMVNTNLYNVYFSNLYISNFGEWSGSLVGWTNATDSLEREEACDGCGSGGTNIDNLVFVENNIASSAVTGKNTIEGESAEITTGNAYSSVSLINFINTNIVASKGFIGFINIFGRLNGNIGTAEALAANEDVEEEPPVVALSSESEPSPEVKEAGGKLEVTHTQNVGEFVYPGDTVTFFAKVRNAGFGKVYGVKLYISLIKDGINYGGAYFDLGDINAQKSVKLTTGIVLSKNAESGLYTAVVSGEGIVGPNDLEIESSSESQFYIASFYPTVYKPSSIIGEIGASDGNITPEVLGASTGNKLNLQKLFGLFISLTVIYVVGRLYQTGNLLIVKRWQGNI